MDEPMKKLAADYRLHVINLTDLDENKFESGLRELIGMMKRKDDKKALLTYCRENEKRFAALDDDTYDLICTMLHMKTLKIKKEENRNPKKETLNMCKAIEDLIKESKEEGAAIGRKEGAKAGEERLSALIVKLAQDNRMAEALSAAKSVRTRRKLYQEYGI